MHAELVTLLTAATPVSEIRGAIPVGLALGLSPLSAYVWAVLGNCIIIVPLLLFLRFGAVWLRRHSSLVDRVLSAVIERVSRLHGPRFEGASTLALAAFVAVPFPITGAWTACIIAVTCQLPFWKSASAIGLGVVTAGIIVLTISLGIIKIW